MSAAPTIRPDEPCARFVERCLQRAALHDPADGSPKERTDVNGLRDEVRRPLLEQARRRPRTSATRR